MVLVIAFASYTFRQSQGGADIALLAALVATAEEYDYQFTSTNEVDAIAGPVVDPQFANAFAYRLGVACIAERQPADSHKHPRLRLKIAQAGESVGVGRRLAHLDHARL